MDFMLRGIIIMEIYARKKEDDDCDCKYFNC
jgi:hypothetical protein